MKPTKLALLLLSTVSVLAACNPTVDEVILSSSQVEQSQSYQVQESVINKELVESESSQDAYDREIIQETSQETSQETIPVTSIIGSTDYHEGLRDPLPNVSITNPVPQGYKLLTVDGGNQSGYREPLAVVNIGFNDGPISREYYAYTNEHGQVIKVIAQEVIIQDESVEPLKSNNRYYHDEAKVPGVESSSLDEGHILADSLGGVSNAYNITPQNSTLNRHGDQAEFERDIRNSNGAYDFIYLIEYQDTETQIPSHYYVEYTNKVSGIRFKTNFSNGDPQEYNNNNGITGQGVQTTPAVQPTIPSQPVSSLTSDVSVVDTNGNGKVTIQEAKDAGFKMPITREHWLYQYMDDRDGDGMVGE